MLMLRKEKDHFPPRTKDEKEVLRRLLKVLRIHNEATRRVEGQDKSPDEACGNIPYCSTREWSHI